jgi:hypothetical protein
VFESGAGAGLFVPKPSCGHGLPALQDLNGKAAKLPGWLTATLMAAAAIARFAAGGIRPSFRPAKSRTERSEL